MKLHEYQARELLASYGVPVPEASLARTPEEARAATEALGGRSVVKAQVHAGGRGKAGGVKVVVGGRFFGVVAIEHINIAMTRADGQLVIWQHFKRA